MWRGNFSENKAILKKSQDMWERKLPFEKKTNKNKSSDYVSLKFFSPTGSLSVNFSRGISYEFL